MINVALSAPVMGVSGEMIDSVTVKMPPLGLVDRPPPGVTELAHNMGLMIGLPPSFVDRLSEADQLAIAAVFETILDQWNRVTALRNTAFISHYRNSKSW